MRFCVDVLDMAVIGGTWVAEEEALEMLGAVLVVGTKTGVIMEGWEDVGVG